MRFFTRVALKGLKWGVYEMWDMFGLLGGKDLTPAKALGAAAASSNPLMWGYVCGSYPQDWNTVECLREALYGAARGDNVGLMGELLVRIEKLPEGRFDVDTLLVTLAAHGSTAGWGYATRTLGLKISHAGLDALVDAALMGGETLILDALEADEALPARHRSRMAGKRRLDAAVKTGDPNLVRTALADVRCLKACDLMQAERFAQRKRYDYLLRSVIHPAMDHAIGDWGAYDGSLAKKAVPEAEPVPLKQAA